MADDAVVHSGAGDGPPTHGHELFGGPWPWLVAGAALNGTAVVLGLVPGLGSAGGEWVDFARATLVTVGLIAAGAGIVIRTAPPVVLSAALLALLALVGVPAGWDSIHLLLRVMAVVGVLSGLVLALPWSARRVVISVLVVAHFGGILTAITSAPPPNSQGSWIMNQLWSRVYRPYLQFVYLNNAYHFYSPEPGPAALLWARVAYEDGSSKRLTLVDRDLFPLRLRYQRRLALTAQIETSQPSSQPFDRLLNERKLAGHYHQPAIPMMEDVPEGGQYREPTAYAKQVLSSVARYIVLNNPHPERKAVTGVKLYQVVHRILNAPEFAAGFEPTDPTSYIAFYAGDYTPEGELKAGHFDDQGRLVDACYQDTFIQAGPEKGTHKVLYQDPFLWWMIPIQRNTGFTEAAPPKEQTGAPQLDKAAAEARLARRVRNYVKIHAGDDDEYDAGRMIKDQDADGDGKISRAEARDWVKKNFDLLDKDQNGYVDRDELLRGLENEPW